MFLFASHAPEDAQCDEVARFLSGLGELEPRVWLSLLARLVSTAQSDPFRPLNLGVTWTAELTVHRPFDSDTPGTPLSCGLTLHSHTHADMYAVKVRGLSTRRCWRAPASNRHLVNGWALGSAGPLCRRLGCSAQPDLLIDTWQLVHRRISGGSTEDTVVHFSTLCKLPHSSHNWAIDSL